MTDYDAMTDEELAVLMAERVMGWAWDGDLSAWVSVIDEGGDVRWHCDRLTWAPATQWNDAGRVLEKMRERGWTWTLRHEPNALARVDLNRRADSWTTFVYADSRSVLRAICIAALRAVDA